MGTVQIRLGGDGDMLKTLTLSEAMIIVYRDGAAIDETFGPGTFKETKTATSKGASTWRKPWNTERKLLFGDSHTTSPLEKFSKTCVTAAKSGEVSYAKARTELDKAFNKV